LFLLFGKLNEDHHIIGQ